MLRKARLQTMQLHKIQRTTNPWLFRPLLRSLEKGGLFKDSLVNSEHIKDGTDSNAVTLTPTTSIFLPVLQQHYTLEGYGSYRKAAHSVWPIQ